MAILNSALPDHPLAPRSLMLNGPSFGQPGSSLMNTDLFHGTRNVWILNPKRHANIFTGVLGGVNIPKASIMRPISIRWG